MGHSQSTHSLRGQHTEHLGQFVLGNDKPLGVRGGLGAFAARVSSLDGELAVCSRAIFICGMELCKLNKQPAQPTQNRHIHTYTHTNTHTLTHKHTTTHIYTYTLTLILNDIGRPNRRHKLRVTALCADQSTKQMPVGLGARECAIQIDVAEKVLDKGALAAARGAL